MKKAIIVDLDNTLFDSREIDKELPANPYDRSQWDQFHKLYGKEKVNIFIRDLVAKYADTHTILFITSREAKGTVIKRTLQSIKVAFTIIDKPTWDGADYDAETIFLLKDYLLLTRKEDDYRMDETIKREIYDIAVKDRYKVELALDDKPMIIKMWNELGIPGLLVVQ